MKIKIIISILTVAVLLTACNSNENLNNSSVVSKEPAASYGEVIDEKALLVLDENDYLKGERVIKEEQKIVYKDAISFAEAFPGAEKTDLSSLEPPRTEAAMVGIDDFGNIYYQSEKGDTHENGEIYSYNLDSKEWKILVSTDNNHNCAYIFADDKYLLWMEDENANWKKSSLHLLDLKTKEDKEFYKHTIDPETGEMYIWQFLNPVLIDGKVYFEDVVAKDEAGNYKIKVFSYSISENKVVELAEDARTPMEYNGKPSWLKRSEDKKNSLFYSTAEEGKALFKNQNFLGTVFSASGDLLVANDRMSKINFDALRDGKKVTNPTENPTKDELSVSYYGIKLYKNSSAVPIILVGGNGSFITNAVTNGEIVAWRGYDVGRPMLYSDSLDKLVTFDDISDSLAAGYSFIISNKYIVLKYSAKGSEKENTICYKLS